MPAGKARRQRSVSNGWLGFIAGDVDDGVFREKHQTEWSGLDHDASFVKVPVPHVLGGDNNADDGSWRPSMLDEDRIADLHLCAV